MSDVDIEKLIKSKFSFLFEDYGFIISGIPDDYLCYLKSDVANIKFSLYKYQCELQFWPNSEKESDAISTVWLLDFYASNRTAQTNDDSFPVFGEAININNCFRQQSLMLRKMSDLLFTSNYDWWDTAVDYVKKRIELIEKKYSQKSS